MLRNRFSSLVGCVIVSGTLAAGCASAAAPATPTQSPPTKSPPTASVPAAKATVPPAPASPSVTPAAAADQPRSGGVLSRSQTDDLAHLDIHQTQTLNVQQPLANVYNGLVRFDAVEVDKLAPDLAEKWDVSPDGKTYTFQLRKEVKWHDGKPFTSEDARFSLERMAFGKQYGIVSPRGGQMLTAVEKVEASDPSTLKVTLKYASGSFLRNMASGWILIFPKHVIEAKGDMKKDAIGTGPFKWKSWNPGIANEVVKNPDYFIKGKPYLDGVMMYIIRDIGTRFAAFRTGRVRMTGLASRALTHVEAEIARKEMGDKVTVISHAAGMRYIIVMNTKRKPWDDVRVRQAIEVGLDRQAAIAVNNNVGMLGGALYPDGTWGISKEEIAKRAGYRQPKDADIAEAKRLVAEAGFPQGVKTNMLIRDVGTANAQGIVAKEQMARFGIDAALQPRDSGAIEQPLIRRDFDLLLWSQTDPVDDPDVALSQYVTGGSANYGDFSDKQIDDLFQKQAAILDEKERKKVVVEMQQRILDLAVYPIVFWDVYNMGFWKEVRGYKPGFACYTHNNLDYVWLAK